MSDVWEEVGKQWRSLVEDPRGPAHFCDSRRQVDFVS